MTRGTNPKGLNLRLDVVVDAAEESHGLSRELLLLYDQIEQRALRQEEQQDAEDDGRDAAEAGYQNHAPRETGTVRVQYADHEQQLEEDARDACDHEKRGLA